MNNLVETLVERLVTGGLQIVDLTAPLSEETQVLRLPEPLVNSPKFKLELLSDFDDDGPLTYWNSFTTGEHTGTHLDAPNHWVSGRGGADVASIPLTRLVGPAVVIDKTEEVSRDPNFLLSRADIEAWCQEHGELPGGGWLLFKTGWSSRVRDAEAFRNEIDGHPNTPGIEAETARWIAEDTGIVGIGVETVGTDAGKAMDFSPPFPVHHYMHGNNKYGVTQLQNLSQLPATGALIVVAPLPIVGGSGSPVRVFAIVESGR